MAKFDARIQDIQPNTWIPKIAVVTIERADAQSTLDAKMCIYTNGEVEYTSKYALRNPEGAFEVSNLVMDKLARVIWENRGHDLLITFSNTEFVQKSWGRIECDMPPPRLVPFPPKYPLSERVDALLLALSAIGIRCGNHF